MPFYLNGRGLQRKLVLTWLEESFGSSEPVDLSQSTIEHVMPQTLNEQWRSDLAADDLPGGWADVDLDPAYTEPVVAALAARLAAAGVPPAVSGEELDGGVIVDLAWPDARVAMWPDARVAVMLADTPKSDIEDLRTAGWTVHPVHADFDDVSRSIGTSVRGAEQVT